MDKKQTSTLLDGVSFKLEKLDSNETTVDSGFTVLSGTTDSNGIVTFGTPSTYQGLTAGVYILTETQAKDGYNNLSETVTITIGTDGTITAEGTNTNTPYNTDANSGQLLKVTVTNGAGYELPLTGGTGVWMYAVIGIARCGTAGFLFFRRRKRRA